MLNLKLLGVELSQTKSAMDAMKSFIGDEDECLIVDMMAKKYARPKMHIVSSVRIANEKKMEKLIAKAKGD